jgi:hypothetical protein
MSDYVLHPGSLYEYTAGTYCGVLVTEPVMRRLVRLQTKHLEAVKRLLTDQAAVGNVFPADWTLHYPAGVQTVVHFIGPDDALARIAHAIHSSRPKHVPLVFVAPNMAAAEAMANAHYEATKGGEDG